MDTVSVVIPTFNEERYIKNTLLSFLKQKKNKLNIEIIVVDGGSTDSTLDIIELMMKEYSNISLYFNPNKKSPFALNIGIKKSLGKYVLIAGAHSLYPDDYIQVCMDELLSNRVVGCSGKTIIKPSSNSIWARLSSWVVGSPFGTSPNSFRNMKEGFAETLPRAIYKKSILFEVGLYNENLYRNQDNDINTKIVSKGYKLFYTWKTSSVYYAKGDLLSLFKFAYSNGLWNITSLLVNPDSMKLHHFIPLVFVVVLFLLLFSSVFFNSNLITISFFFIVLLHLFVGLVTATNVYFKTKDLFSFLLPPVFFLFHVSYGIGSLVSIVKVLYFRFIKNG